MKNDFKVIHLKLHYYIVNKYDRTQDKIYYTRKLNTNQEKSFLNIYELRPLLE